MNLVEWLVNLVVYGVVFFLVWWFIGYLEGQFPLPVPVYKVVRVLLVLFAIVWLIGLLTGNDYFSLPRIHLR